MNPASTIMFAILAAFMLIAPRGWTLAPFLAGCCLNTLGQGLEIGPMNMSFFRLLIFIGIIRVMARGEVIVGGLNTIDKFLIGWACWYFLSSFFHDPKLDSGTVYVCGQIYTLLGFYFLARIWVNGYAGMVNVIRITALLLAAIAVEMLIEKTTGKNFFSYFGGVPEDVLVREGRLRAQGPFLHAILAGTVGATCIPWFFGVLREQRVIAMIGIAAGLVMVFTCASSGPIISLFAAIFALAMWNFKNYTTGIRIGAFLIYLILMVVMKSPPYYLISRIDLSGGSTGYHRAYLIDMTITHFDEWWLFGTDYTRHWMPFSGTAMSPTHTDITNYYIGFAVGGGIIAMMLILFALGKCFVWVGFMHDELIEDRPNDAFLIWCFGAALFSHGVTGISVAYFDQSVVFIWLNVAAISSCYSGMISAVKENPESDNQYSLGEPVPVKEQTVIM